MNRRDFLKQAGAVSVGAALTGCAHIDKTKSDAPATAGTEAAQAGSPESIRMAEAGAHTPVTVPDTLDLAERARLAIDGIGNCIDPALLTMYGQIYFATPKPFLSHWASADNTCDPKFAESLPLLRLMCGSDRHIELEARYREALCRRIQDGLYWDIYTPKRPWRNDYAVKFYGKGRDADFAPVYGAGRMMRALMVWRELGDQSPQIEEQIISLLQGLNRIAVRKDDYSYYPEKGGWGEPCCYTRSGWLNTDEARGETEGGEGAVTCFQSQPIYAAAHWHAQTVDPTARDLAARLSHYVIQPKFWGGLPDFNKQGDLAHISAPLPDPPFTAGGECGHWYSHFHARAVTLRSLLEYAREFNDERAAEFVRRGYEFSLTQGIARTGWINCFPGALNRMESCALGDLIALAIRLTDAGLGDYWDDVDAIARNQLVEQQLVNPGHLQRIAEACKDQPEAKETLPGQYCFDNVIERGLGVFAGTALPTSIPNPSVMQCCTGNASQGLYYAWEGIVRESGDRATVNLFLNRAARLVDVDSYLPYEGKVVIHIKAARRVAIRIPSWVDVRSLRAEVAGKPCAVQMTGRYAEFEHVKPGTAVVLTFPIAEKEYHCTVNAHSSAEIQYSCVFRGSTLVDISPRDLSPTSYPLYERAHLRQPAAPMKQRDRFVASRIVHQW